MHASKLQYRGQLELPFQHSEARAAQHVIEATSRISLRRSFESLCTQRVRRVGHDICARLGDVVNVFHLSMAEVLTAHGGMLCAVQPASVRESELDHRTSQMRTKLAIEPGEDLRVVLSCACCADSRGRWFKDCWRTNMTTMFAAVIALSPLHPHMSSS